VLFRSFQDAFANEGYALTVDLAEQTIATPTGDVIKFEVDPERKHRLLNGLDDIGITLQFTDKIQSYEAKRRQEAPWLFA
jgi:3-isopropylmalate/(R)-2-methylmalate dehydratase small subunit